MPSEANEWVEWHRSYDGDRARTQRLELVRERIREALSESPPGPIRVVSVCAGDGRDLLGALEGHPRAGDVRARLVELTPELVSAGCGQAHRQHLAGVEFVRGDAATTSTYEGAVPARLVIVCGVFGNISDSDIHRTVTHLPELCAENATVIWTRGRVAPDLTPTIREWFRETGFAEVSFVPIPDSTASVGTHRLTGPPKPFRAGVHLFTFLPKAERPSTRASPPGS